MFENVFILPSSVVLCFGCVWNPDWKLCSLRMWEDNTSFTSQWLLSVMHAHLISKFAYNPWFPLLETLYLLFILSIMEVHDDMAEILWGQPNWHLWVAPLQVYKGLVFLYLQCQLAICLNLLVFKIIIITSFIKSSYFFSQILACQLFLWTYIKLTAHKIE